MTFLTTHVQYKCQCLWEEIAAKTLAVADFGSEGEVKVQIIDSQRQEIQSRDHSGGDEGKFAFTSTGDGLYGICFFAPVKSVTLVPLNMISNPCIFPKTTLAGGEPAGMD